MSQKRKLTTRNKQGTGRRPCIGRRDFIRRGSAGLAGAGLTTLLHGGASGQDQQKSRVIMVKHDEATDDRGVGNPAVVKKLVARCIAELTGEDSPRDAWREFVSPDDVVGIKVNCIARKNFSTQVCVVDAIVDGLTSAGVKPNNIIVWDRWNWEMESGGYQMNMSDEGVRCYGTDRGSFEPAKLRHVARGDRDKAIRELTGQFYSEKPTDIAGVPAYLSKILLDEVTALINVPLIKDHGIAGVTCSMKNHFGSIINPSDLHLTNGDPYLAHLNLASPIREKTRLIVTDVLRAVYNGGPGDSPDRWRQNAVMMGTDTVAMDALALRIVEQKRQEHGFPPIGERARYVATAATMGLGTNDAARIDLKEIDITAST